MRPNLAYYVLEQLMLPCLLSAFEKFKVVELANLAQKWNYIQASAIEIHIQISNYINMHPAMAANYCYYVRGDRFNCTFITEAKSLFGKNFKPNVRFITYPLSAILVCIVLFPNSDNTYVTKSVRIPSIGPSLPILRTLVPSIKKWDRNVDNKLL